MKRLLLLLALLPGCIGESEPLATACPPFDTFEPQIAPLLERRCASLDCHGAEGRALLVFADHARRRPGAPFADDPNYVTGGLPTTRYEHEGTYQSVCGLQPEIMEAVVRGEEPTSSLTLVRKPRLDEKHKGGRVWPVDGPGDLCLQSWLLGRVDEDACRDELLQP